MMPLLLRYRTAGAPLLAALAVVLISGCAGSDNALKSRAVAGSGVAFESPEVAALDERLDGIDERSEATRTRVDTLQARISERMGSGPPLAGLDLSGSQLYIEVDRHSLIRTNGIAMNRGDFDTFAGTRGKTLCAPTPVLAVDARANYDTVAWVLERIYAEGCAEVDLLELKDETRPAR